MRLRFNIASLLASVGFCGICFAAFHSASLFWVNATFYLLIATLIFAACKAKLDRGRNSAWWYGYALFGGSYLSLGFAALYFRDIYGVAILFPSLAIWEFLPIPDTPDGLFESMTSGNRSAKYLIFHNGLSSIFGLVGAWLCWSLAVRFGDDESPASKGDHHDRS